MKPRDIILNPVQLLILSAIICVLTGSYHNTHHTQLSSLVLFEASIFAVAAYVVRFISSIFTYIDLKADLKKRNEAVEELKKTTEKFADYVKAAQTTTMDHYGLKDLHNKITKADIHMCKCGAHPMVGIREDQDDYSCRFQLKCSNCDIQIDPQKSMSEAIQTWNDKVDFLQEKIDPII